MRTLLAALAATLAPAMSQAIEEPDHQVLQRLGDAVEVREYAPYVVAQVRVPGPAQEAGNTAFPILAGYIFGKNKGERRLAMTAPVTQTATPATEAPAQAVANPASAPSAQPAPDKPVKLAMTAPVTQAAEAGGFVVQFVLPKGVTLANAPEPLDTRVQLREVPASRLAVIRYRGTWSQANYDEHLAQLQATLRTAGMAWQGEPVLSRYDPPITPWFLRRNEIWLTLR